MVSLESFSKKTKKKRNTIQRKTQITEENIISFYITKELLDDILIRLPIKSLVRFKSVCKPWGSFIQSLTFTNSHRQLHSGDHSGKAIFSPSMTSSKSHRMTSDNYIQLTRGPLDDLVLPMEMTQLEPPSNGPDASKDEWGTEIRTLGPLNNGMYCVIANLHRNIGRISVYSNKVSIFNPATREFKLANPFPSEFESLLTKFSKRVCCVHYGFGCVKKRYFGVESVDYRFVVVINWGKQCTSFLSFVYSLQSGKWRKIVDFEHGYRDFSSRNAIEGLRIQDVVHYPEITQDLELCPQRFFKGCWHWMALRIDSIYTVLSFNLANDAFKLIAGPLGYSYRHPTDLYVKGGVFVLNDHLNAIYLSLPSFASISWIVEIDVWKMTEYGVEDSWTKIYNINPTFGGRLSRIVGMSLCPMIYEDDDGDCIDRIFFEDCNKQLVSCDEDGFKKHNVHNLSSSICWNTLGISTYVETFESISPSLLEKWLHCSQI